MVRDAARPALEVLAERFGETALLTVREGDEAVAIDQVLGAGSRIVHVRYRTGYRHPLDVAAHGRALLAPPPPDRERPAAIVSEGELEPDVRGVAAPIFDARVSPRSPASDWSPRPTAPPRSGRLPTPCAPRRPRSAAASSPTPTLQPDPDRRP